MLRKLIKFIPEQLIVDIWRFMPLPQRLRNFLLWHANAHFMVGVIGLIYAKNGDLLFVKHTYRKTPWGLPGGTLGKEQPFAGLQREVMEETGFQIAPYAVADAIYFKEPAQMILIIKAELVGGLFTPSPEVSDFCFINPKGDLSRIPKLQRKFVKKYHTEIRA